MPIRAGNEGNDTASASPGVEDIRKLAPFVDLTDVMLGHIAGSGHYESVNLGRLKYDPDGAVEYFLVDGSLRFVRDDEKPRGLTHAMPAAAFPLPLHNHWTISVIAPVRLLVIPSRYLDLDPGHKSQQNDNLVLENDTADSRIYLEFYHALQRGKYELPSLPDLAVRIGKAIDDPNTLNGDIARLIQLDPSLTARVMSVVNSAAYGGVSEIRTVQGAVARLGRQHVRNLVFSCIIKGLFRTDSAMLKKRMGQIWEHSCRVAAISFVLARHTPGLDPDRALLAGLIHEIGAIPIIGSARNSPEISRDAELLENVLDDLVQGIGVLTLEQWGFDNELIDVARRSRDWQRTGTALADYLDVIQIAKLHAYIGQRPRYEVPPIDAVPAFRKLALGQLTPRHSLGVLENAAKDIDEVQRLLQYG